MVEYHKLDIIIFQYKGIIIILWLVIRDVLIEF